MRKKESLREKNPEAAAMWDYDLNDLTLNPDIIGGRSDLEAYFKCLKNPKHTFKKRVSKMTSDRTGLSTGCIYCGPNPKIPFPGETDLLSTVPEAISMWDYEKNLNLDPKQILPKSAKKAFFKCAKNHSVLRKISDFTNSTRCPTCRVNESRIIYHHPHTPAFWNTSKNTNNFYESEKTSSCKQAFFDCPKCKYEWKWNLFTWHNNPFCPSCGFDGMEGSEKRNRDQVSKFAIITLRQANPKVEKYWDFEKNKGISIDSVTFGSNKKVWLKCQKGHSFERTVWFITNKEGTGTNCPICHKNHSKIITGINDFLSTCEEAKRMWDYKRNIKIDPANLSNGSRERVHFICKKGHSFTKQVHGFYVNPVCPKCVLIEQKSIQVASPKMLKFWDYDRMKVLPTEVKPYSKELGYWKCSRCNYEWTQQFCSRVVAQKNKCPSCELGHQSENSQSFLEYHPEAAKLWISDLNNGLTPDVVSFRSGKSVFMRCPENSDHIYKIKVRSIYSKKPYGCPECSKGSRRPVIRGKTDLFTLCKDAKQMWSWDKNSHLDPYILLPNSSQAAWFKCPEDHYFSKKIYDFNRVPRCPYCTKLKTAVTNYDHLMKQWDFEKNSHLDVNVVSATSKRKVSWLCKKCGYKWQSEISSRKASKGNCPCCETRIVVEPGKTDLFTLVPQLREQYDFKKNIRIDKNSLSVGKENKVWWHCPTCSYGWCSSPSSRVKKVNEGYEISDCPVCSGNRRLTTFFDEFPDLEEKFVRGLNEISFDRIHTYKQANEKYWWHCDLCEEDFETSLTSMIRARETTSKGCSYCSGKKVIKSKSFAYLHPSQMSEFDANNSIDPYTVTENSNLRVNWICNSNKKHKWQATFYSRSKGEGNCPDCRGYRYGLMFSKEHPQFEEFYDSDKNDCIFSSLTNQSNYKVWWKCKEGHSFRRSVYRYSSESKFSCPICENQRIIVGINSLLDTNPDLCEEWGKHNEKEYISFSNTSSHSVLWDCPDCEGSYSAVIKHRCHNDKGCPYCSNRAALEGFNTIASIKPDLVDQWSSNNERDISEFTFKSSYWAKWNCLECNGEYSARIDKRIEDNHNCPYCSNRKPLLGLNTVLDMKPGLFKEWSPNNEHGIASFTANSKQYALWICQTCEGEYSASIQNRDEGDDSCPYCSNKVALKGFNTLVDIKPELSKQWSPNNIRCISEFTYSSSHYVLWNCPDCKGEYSACIKSREIGDDACPYCANKKPLKGFNTVDVFKPQLTNQWSSYNERNIHEYVYTSVSLAMWNCLTCGGEYPLRICDKEELSDDACPYCANKKPLKGFNTVDVFKPQLANQWSSYNGRNIHEYVYTSASLAMWNCLTCGGEYLLRICDKEELNDDACPYCTNRKVLPGFNSFAVRHPDLLDSWDYVNNAILLDPDFVLDYCNIKVWWICDKEGTHKYQLSPKQRLYFQKRNIDPCSECKGRRRKRRHFI